MSQLEDVVRQAHDKWGTSAKIAEAVEDNLADIAHGYGYVSTVDQRYGNRVWPLPELHMIPWILQSALFDKNVLVYCQTTQEARGLLDGLASHAQKQYGQHIIRKMRRVAGDGEIEFINEARVVFAVPSRGSHGYGADWLRVRGIR